MHKNLKQNFEMKKVGSIGITLLHRKDNLSNTVCIFNHKDNFFHINRDTEISTTTSNSFSNTYLSVAEEKRTMSNL